MSSKKILISGIVLALLIFGPTGHGWAWLAIRLLYLLIIPLVAWVLLELVWNSWNPSLLVEDRLRRSLWGGIGGALLVMAIVSFQSKSHFECTEELRSRDEIECVGEYVKVEGPDLWHVIFLAGSAAFAFWLSLHSDRKEQV